MSDADRLIDRLSERLGAQLLAQAQTIATAESCTGGGIAEAITRVAGSSQWFEFGWVTYANQAKISQLGVVADDLARSGAVSAVVVEQMAAGALRAAGADFALAVSGVAGPDGGTLEKPVGTVWLGWASDRGAGARLLQLQGDRQAIRQQTVIAALEQAIALSIEPGPE